jgi:thiol-disulfide isomerase/thioredoxin
MKLSRRTFGSTAFAAIALLSCLPAQAGGEKYTDAAFEAAQKAGKPILVDISAAWCPVCRVQAPIVEDLAMSDKFKDLVHLEVDFDRQKDVLRRLNAPRQSTLIVFKGTAEVGRSVGDVNRQSIEAMMEKALK